MDEEKKTVEEETQVAVTEQGVEENPVVAPKQEEVNYQDLLAQEIARANKAENDLLKSNEDRDNYKKGLLKAKGKVDDDEEEEETIGDLVKREIANGLRPVIQNLTKGTVESAISKISSNPDEQKLIQFYYDNKIVHSGTDEASIASDLEAAKAIANRNKLAKASEEIRIARENKNQISNNSMGTSTEGYEPKKEYFTKEQIAHLEATAKAIGTDPAEFVKKAEENAKRFK